MPRPNRGMTLIEVLVAISIIAVLIAILMPAVSAVRESSRLNQCRNNLRQIAQATHQFEAARSHFPGAFGGGGQESKGLSFNYSPQTFLLPHVDQAVVFALIAIEKNQEHMLDPESSSLNKEAIKSVVPVYQCPSDPQSGRGRGACSYRASLGVGPEYSDGRQPKNLRGAFSGFAWRKASEFHDGLGSTAAFSERRHGSWTAQGYDSRRDSWYTAVNQLGSVPPADDMLQLCASAAGTPADTYAYGGATWMFAGFEHTWYNHAALPNASIPACSAGYLKGAPTLQPGAFGANSYHQGVNVAFMDASVRLITGAIDQGVWRSLATLDGGERVEAEF